MPFDLTALQMLFLGVTLFGAGVMRGYSGFAFSALVVMAAALIGPPLHFVPVVVFIEVALSAQMLPSLGKDVDWRRVLLLSAGVLIGLPLGLWGLTALSPELARMVIAALILTLCVILRAGLRIAPQRGIGPNLSVGFFSGAANAAGMGGMPVAAFFAAQSLPAPMFRASLVAFFPILDGLSLPLYWAYGLISLDSFYATALALPPALLGNKLGAWLYKRRAPRDFRGLIIALLILLALGAFLKSFLNLLT